MLCTKTQMVFPGNYLSAIVRDREGVGDINLSPVRTITLVNWARFLRDPRTSLDSSAGWGFKERN